MLLWMSAIGECWQSPGECQHTPNELVNVEKLKYYRHLLVYVDIYVRILVNVDIHNKILVDVDIGTYLHISYYYIDKVIYSWIYLIL